MLIVCPSCSSRYELDAAKLGPAGRKVRCAACKTLWHVEPAPEFPEVPSEDETRALLQEEIARAAVIDEQISAVAAEGQAQDMPAVEPAESEPGPAPAPRRRRAKALRGKVAAGAAQSTRALRLPLALAAGGLALLGLLVWQREAAVRTAPQLAGLFEKLGMPVNIRGLKLGAVESGVVDDGLGRFLVVEGDITNIARHDTPVPAIEVAVKDAAGEIIYTWSTTPPKPSLEPSELVHFRARLATPPANGKTVQVRFAQPKTTGLASAH
jgi:predicted Zn finger-like uncharacterized protein